MVMMEFDQKGVYDACDLRVYTLEYGVFIPLFQVSLLTKTSYTYTSAIHSKLLLKRPLATQCATSAILFASGDIIAQQVVERKREKHDVRVTTATCPFDTLCSIQFLRTARFTFYGGDDPRYSYLPLYTVSDYAVVIAIFKAAYLGLQSRSGSRFSIDCASPPLLRP
jgi:hypothetical protein